MISVKSSIDNKYYLVNNTKHRSEVANVLATLRSKIIFICDNIQNNDDFMKRIRNKIRSTRFIENPKKKPEPNLTSYSVNKGEKIVLCIYDYENEKIYDMNTLLYVCIHELAHIGDINIGHKPSFYSIFNFLLFQSIRLGIYSFYDYSILPVKYCGITIK